MIIHGKMNHTAAELKQKLSRVAISPILLNSVLNGLFSKAIFQLKSGYW